MPKANKNVLGAWAFLIGVILAVLVGLLGWTSSPWPIILLILGIVIGLLNIGGEELKEFMLAGTVLVIVSAFGSQAALNLAAGSTNVVATIVGGIFQALTTLFIPATVIVALKSVFAVAKK